MHIVINGWFRGQLTAGSGQYLEQLLAHLPAQDPQIRWTLLWPLAAGEVLPSAAPTAVTIQPIRLPPLPKNLAKLWWEQVMVPRWAKRLRADRLWVPYWAAPYWQPVPVIVTVHDLIPLLLPAYRGGRLQRAYTWLVSQSARRAAAIITVSAASKRDLVQHLGVSPTRVQVVYHGPNLADAELLNADTLAVVRQKFALPERFFLYVGGFDQRKNVRGILHAYRRYLDKGGDPSVRLVIAGRLPVIDSDFAPDPQKITAALALQGQVQYCGFVDEQEKAALYQLATAYLFPSFYEGFGMMVLEAMGAGTPVITSQASETIKAV